MEVSRMIKYYTGCTKKFATNRVLIELSNVIPQDVSGLPIILRLRRRSSVAGVALSVRQKY